MASTLEKKILKIINENKVALNENEVKPDWTDLGPAVTKPTDSLPAFEKDVKKQPALPLSKPVSDDADGAKADKGKVTTDDIKEEDEEDKKDDKKKDVSESKTFLRKLLKMNEEEDKKKEDGSKDIQKDEVKDKKDDVKESDDEDDKKDDKKKDVDESDDDDSEDDKKKDKEDIKEDVNALFAGEKLTESFKKKAFLIFETAVTKRVNERIERKANKLTETFNTLVNEEIAKQKIVLESNVEKYLDYIAEEWVKTNELAITTGIRADLAENFMNGLKDLFTEHYIEVPQSKVDVVETLSTKVVELEKKLNESIESNLKLKEDINESEKNNIFKVVSTGLVESQIDKLKSKSETLSFTNLDSYKEALETLKESYFPSKKVDNTGTVNIQKNLTEEADVKPLENINEGKNTEMNQVKSVLSRMHQNEK